jgi:hypothetical protein
VIGLLVIAAAAPDLAALDQAIARCDRTTVNPALSGEATRRSLFLTEAYSEQAAIVGGRLAIAERRRVLREPLAKGAPKQVDTVATLESEAQALEDRQRALNDRRMLEGIRQEAMDAKRRAFLSNCPAGSSAERRGK